MSWTGSGNIVPIIITPFAAPVSVSTETPLQTLVELGPIYSSLTFLLRNHDVALNAVLYVDTSESGVVVASQRNIVIVPPLKEYPIDFVGVMRRYFSVSASGDPDAGFAAVNISFEIIGLRRFTVSGQLRSK